MTNDDGYVKNTLFPNQKLGETSNYAMRAQLAAELTQDTLVVFSADIFREDRNPDTGELAI